VYSGGDAVMTVHNLSWFSMRTISRELPLAETWTQITVQVEKQ
jgi:hypothetical protein